MKTWQYILKHVKKATFNITMNSARSWCFYSYEGNKLQISEFKRKCNVVLCLLSTLYFMINCGYYLTKLPSIKLQKTCEYLHIYTQGLVIYVLLFHKLFYVSAQTKSSLFNCKSNLKLLKSYKVITNSRFFSYLLYLCTVN